MKLANFFVVAGFLGIGISVVILTLIYLPIIGLELSFSLKPPDKTLLPVESSNQKGIVVRDLDFGLVIPKIGANVSIVANVDSQKPHKYQQALTKGVAHAKGSSLPGEGGNIFLFSHSSADFYLATRFNSIFYLLNKLQKEDKIYIFYQAQQYAFRVIDKKLVNPEEVFVLRQEYPQDLTLMTCWPPGTTFKRLVVLAKRID
jgi:LPXTG-site transpeptidase (sortase) family protein